MSKKMLLLLLLYATVLPDPEREPILKCMLVLEKCIPFLANKRILHLLAKTFFSKATIQQAVSLSSRNKSALGIGYFPLLTSNAFSHSTIPERDVSSE
ncbi:hypothetical protein AVEN_76035-1 [Araneus ventricosus]|uniref:Secreted protein n=1 Tax=Araneus ventricosus TaxID=182803 RepID=A0A4Y2WIQ4_ARAVE|nr:hypothetical protein AVEN_76035-1 [Araneus ventricosus]